MIFIFLLIVTFVPTPSTESTSTLSIKLSIIVNPIPDLSKFDFVVNNGCLASSIFSIPFPESDISIKTAVSEAVTNAIIHGYEEKIGIVKLICKIAQNEVFIEISDSGKGIENIEEANYEFHCIMPIENLGTIVQNRRSIWQKQEEKQALKNAKKS